MPKKLSEEIATRERSFDYFAIGKVLPDPDYVLRKASKDISVYQELLSDPHVSACVMTRKAGVKKLKWEIDRGKDKTQQSQLIYDLFQGLDIFRLIDDILNAPLFGFQPMEIMWDRMNGYILPEDIVAKPVEWFVFGPENELRFRTRDNFNGVEIPPMKFLLPRHNATYKNPYGERILSKCFWPVTFKKGGQKFRILFLEKYGIPYLIGKHPSGAKDADISNLLDMLENMVQDAVAAIPEDSSIEPLEITGKKASSDVFESQIISSNREISEAILGQALTTDPGKEGSYAKSKVGLEVMDYIIETDQRLVENTINQLIKWIYELNFTGADIPKFTMFKETGVQKERAGRDKILKDTGIRFTKDYYMKNYRLEDEDFDVVEPAPPAEFAERTSKFKDQQAIDEIDFEDKVFQKQIEKMLKPVIGMIKKGSDYSEVMERLASTYPKMDSKDLEKLLARAIFVTETWGRLNAGK